MTMNRDYTPVDRLLSMVDAGVRALAGRPAGSGRPNPGIGEEAELTGAEKVTSRRLMRVNHAGEVAAQGLYQGQALTARMPRLRARLNRAAEEENDHLLWCGERIRELGGRPSYLNPFWYAGSITIGAMAGALGDRWSLGFLGETERQVVRHLQDHLRRLPRQDGKSRAILVQMKRDEERHATVAMNAGGRELSGPVKAVMRLSSRALTRIAYWI